MYSLRMQAKDLKIVRERAQARFAAIQSKYPELDGYLVLSSRFGQSELHNSVQKIFVGFNRMFIDSPQKNRTLELCEQRRCLDRDKKNTDQIDGENKTLISELEISEETQVEIRFGALKYELVWQLQNDELVDLKLTPQTRASIQIVLGRIVDFL